MISPCIPIYAAVSESHTVNGGTRTASLPEFLGEFPINKELSDYLDSVLPVLRSAYGAILRGAVPTHLTQFTTGADDLSGQPWLGER